MLYYFNRICYSIGYSLYVFTSRRIDDYLQSYNPVATEVRITRVIFSDVLRVLPKGRRKWTWNSRNRYTYAIRATRIVNNNVRYVMRWRVNGLSRDHITVVYNLPYRVLFKMCDTVIPMNETKVFFVCCTSALLQRGAEEVATSDFF